MVAVEVEEDGKPTRRIRLESLRPDVAETFPGTAGAERSGFQAVVAVGTRTERVTLHAVTEAGRRFAMGEIQIVPYRGPSGAGDPAESAIARRA